MKKLKELKIMKKQLSVIENSNEDLEIDNIIIKDAFDFKDNFYLENIKFFIKRKSLSVCQSIIRSFDKEKLEPYLEELINIIADSNDYHVMIDLLNYNQVQIKDKDKKPLKDFRQQENKMNQKIIDSNDPIVYLRAAIYYYGMRWKSMNWIPFKQRYEIEDIILSYDFKKFNLNFRFNMYYDETKEPYTYFQLLLIYCRDYSNSDRWLEAEQKVFKFVPIFMDKYIKEVVKGKNEQIEDILLEMDVPDLYFNYAKDILKKEWEHFRTEQYLKHSLYPMKEEVIDAAIDSIASDPYLVTQYAELFKKRLSSKMENAMFIELNKKIDYYYNNYFHFEAVIGIYLYLRKFKENFPLFERFLIKLNNLREGLKLDEPYEEDDLEADDFDEANAFKKVLDEVIYNYILTNRNDKILREIGINNRNDLLKLKEKIVENGNTHDQIKASGYGELDY
jgi:hypothetical protein